MAVLGLFLLIVAGVVTTAMVLQNTDASRASVFGQAVHASLGGLFLAGVVTGAIALLGLTLMLAGARRRRARRNGLKRQVREAHGERESLTEENARLQRELEASRSGTRQAYPATDTTTDTTTETTTGTGTRGLFKR